ncbi:hypothetical protein Vi05172_g8901 [Venturia inaequalis]|nr:hypothetical protein Vi05172_g8901 [Venturia inaequalis]
MHVLFLILRLHQINPSSPAQTQVAATSKSPKPNKL